MESIELHLEGHPPVWMYVEDYEQEEGALMPSPDHAMETFGMGISYAHVYRDGTIMRLGKEIGRFAELCRPGEIVQ